MASYTPNYNLKKPAGTDVVDIADLNGNMDIIDTQLASLSNKISTGTMLIPCSSGTTKISYSNLPSGKPDTQQKFLKSLYQCINHGVSAEITTCCIDGVDLIIQTATAQNVTIRWFYFETA